MLKKWLIKKIIIWFCNKEAKSGNIFPYKLYDSPNGYLIEFINISFSGDIKKITQYINSIEKNIFVLQYILSLLHLFYPIYCYVDNMTNDYGKQIYYNDCFINKLIYMKKHSIEIYKFNSSNLYKKNK